MRSAVKATVDYKGVPLVCEFAYYAGSSGTLETPPEPETAELSSVKAGAVEIIDVFNEDQLFEIGDACLAWYRDERAYQASEHADMQREERALAERRADV